MARSAFWASRAEPNLKAGELQQQPNPTRTPLIRVRVQPTKDRIIRVFCESGNEKPSVGLPRQATTTRATHARRTKPTSSSTSAMQSPASDIERYPDRYVVRLSGALAALLGRAEGAELPEIDLLGRLRQWGLITYPSPLGGRLLGELPEVLAAEVLPQLDPTDLAMFARVGLASRAAVVSSGLPRTGEIGGGAFELEEFCGSVQRLAWARANGCPWVPSVCALAAASGRVEVLQWAREHGCDWDENTCAEAAEGGHLEVLMWAREHGCPWEEVHEEDDDEEESQLTLNCCALAAGSGHLEVLKWTRENGCPWDVWTCALAAGGGHLEVLQWAREHGCPWQEDIEDHVEEKDCCALAAEGGHLEVRKWLRENDCPWDESTCAWAALDGQLEALKWAREHHCPWSERTTCCAAIGGHLEVLKWLREHHCPWDAQTRIYAEEHGHLELLQWAVEHGAP